MLHFSSALRAAALAGSASLVLWSAAAPAMTVNLVLDPSQSTITQQWRLYGPGIGSNPATPQYAGSDTTTYSGQLSIELQTGTIEFLPSASISAAIGAAGDGGTPGRYSPLDPVTSDPLAPPNQGFQDDSNYGLRNVLLGLYATLYDIEIAFGAPSAGLPLAPLALAGTSFNLFGQGMEYTNGRQALVSVLGNSTESLVGIPAVAFGTSGVDIGTWDGTTLTIPIHSIFTVLVTSDLGGIYQDFSATGVLVAHMVPEPSTGTLLGFGIIGLASRARGTRRRKAVSGEAQ